MRKSIAVFILLFCAGLAYAQTQRTIKDIDRELKQVKSTATAMELISAIGETEPQTDEEVQIMGQLMDKYPVEGQKAAMRIKDPKLVKAVMQECEREINAVIADRNKDWKGLSVAQRQAKTNAILNAYTLMGALGNLKNKEALPFLKQYVTPNYDGEISYTASQAIGRIAPNDPAVFSELWGKSGVKSINYGAYGASVLKEVAQRLQGEGLSSEERDKIRAKANVGLLNGGTPEEKHLLKDIVINHPDEDLRKDAGLALTKAMMFHPDADDVDFILKWTKNPKDMSGSFAMTYMRDHYDNRFAPVVLNYLKNGDDYARSKAVGLAGQQNIKEALPYIKECITKDKDSAIRGDCRITYWKMTGDMSSEFTPEDAGELEEYLNNPRMVAFHLKMDDENPRKIKYLELQKAIKKYRRTHK